MRTSASLRAAADTRRLAPRRLRLGAAIATASLALTGALDGAARAAPRAGDTEQAAARSGELMRLAQASTGPLVIDGPVRGAAGGTASLPVRIAPGSKSRGRYVVVLKAPDWLSFKGGEQIGAGMWLLDREKLAGITVAFAAAAAGTAELSVGLGGKTGEIDSVTPLRVEIAATPAKVPATTGAIAENEIKPPAPVAATRTAQAVPPDAPANAPAGFTWEKLIGGDKPAAAPAQPKPAAAAPGASKSEAELIQEAKHLVRECTTCHNLYGQDVGIPVMVGLTVDRFLDTMDLYRREKRDHKLMQVISKSLSEEETKALALYLSRIKPAAPSDVAAAGSLARMPAPETQASAQQPMSVSKREIDDKTRDRINRWLKRGEQMLQAGEIAQARLLLERASEFGDPRAAFLMATSFDPNALPWRPGIGMVAEPLKARRWYLLAKSLGAGAETDQRLADLP